MSRTTMEFDRSPRAGNRSRIHDQSSRSRRVSPGDPLRLRPPQPAISPITPDVLRHEGPRPMKTVDRLSPHRPISAGSPCVMWVEPARARHGLREPTVPRRSPRSSAVVRNTGDRNATTPIHPEQPSMLPTVHRAADEHGLLRSVPPACHQQKNEFAKRTHLAVSLDFLYPHTTASCPLLLRGSASRHGKTTRLFRSSLWLQRCLCN